MISVADGSTDMESGENIRSTIFAVGGGKGGVGKTVITASLGVGLSMLDKRVVVVDVDLGGADLHSVIGIEKPDRTYHHFLRREYQRLDDVLLEHPSFPSMKILCGAMGSLGDANLPNFQKQKFIRHLEKLDADFIILDLGAGTSYNVLDFFLTADQGIVVVNPDLLSILESYNFLKLVVFRKIAQIIRGHEGALELIQRVVQAETHKESSTVDDLVRGVMQMDADLGSKIEYFLEAFHPMILINMMEEAKEKEKVLSIQAAARELLSVQTIYIGAIRRDKIVRKSLDKMVPFIRYDTKANASKDLTHIISTEILHNGRLQSFRTRHTIRKKGKEDLKAESEEVMCSVRCPYWEECEFKNGGYPCDLHHLTQISGARGEK
ncbi:MAG: P-loop NTPase [bacterium]